MADSDLTLRVFELVSNNYISDVLTDKSISELHEQYKNVRQFIQQSQFLMALKFVNLDEAGKEYQTRKTETLRHGETETQRDRAVQAIRRDIAGQRVILRGYQRKQAQLAGKLREIEEAIFRKSMETYGYGN